MFTLRICCSTNACHVASRNAGALVSWNHVLDIDERIGTSVSFQHIQCLSDERPYVPCLPLPIVDAIAQIFGTGAQKVENR